MDAATLTMVRNLEEKTGRSLAEWVEVVRASEREKHGEVVKLLKDEHGLTHGYANLVAHEARSGLVTGPAHSGGSAPDLFAGDKAGLEPIYDVVVKAINGVGADVEIAPKKAYVSFRRKKQFAILQPSTRTRLDLGLNLRHVEPVGRLEASGSFNSMCSHRVRLQTVADVDAEVLDWLRRSYEQAG